MTRAALAINHNAFIKFPVPYFIHGTVFREKNASKSHMSGVLSKATACAPAHMACLAYATDAPDLQFN